MAFRKITILIVFLIISLKLSGEVCCDNYSCGLFPDSGNCTSKGCVYENGVCRVWKCSDKSSSSTYCESTSECVYKGGQCIEATPCAAWSDKTASACNSRHNQDTGAQCINTEDGTGCREATCADYKSSSSTCQSANDVGRSGNLCKWSSNDCLPINSCGEFSSTDCIGKFVGGDACFYDGSVCRVWSGCADLNETTTPSCVMGGCVFSSGVCREHTCSDYLSSSCDNGYEPDGDQCHWFNGACHVAECSDYSGTSVSECESNPSYLTCVYANDVCAPPDCGSLTSGSLCYSSGCYYLKSCSVDDPVTPADNSSNSVIFAPALLVALLAALFW